MGKKMLAKEKRLSKVLQRINFYLQPIHTYLHDHITRLPIRNH